MSHTGLVETAEKLVKKKKKGLWHLKVCFHFSVHFLLWSDMKKATPWEQYLQRRKEKKNEVKRKRKRREDCLTEEGETSGFDDPFFHHSVTTATAVSVEGGRGG